MSIPARRSSAPLAVAVCAAALVACGDDHPAPSPEQPYPVVAVLP